MLKFTVETVYTPCEFCLSLTGVLPFGPNGENICYICAEKNPIAAQRACKALERPV